MYQANPLTVKRELETNKKRRTHHNSDLYDVITSDPAVQAYIQKHQPKKGTLSKGTRSHIRTACYRFLRFTDIELSDHAFTDLIKAKLSSPKDRWLDENLNEFYDNTDYKPYYASFIRSIFEANGLTLFPHLRNPGELSLHVWRPRALRKMHPYNETISKDPALARYFNALKNHKRNNGYLSKISYQSVYQASTKFLLYLGREISDHAISDLVRQKQGNPRDFWIEDKLLEFSNLHPLVSHRKYAVRMLGVFRENRARLQATIDYHFTTRTKKISEGILREIFLAQDFEKRTLMEYQAFAGERIQCLSRLDISQIESYDASYSIVRIRFDQNKVRIPHICLIPRRVAEAVARICRETKRFQPFPNYESLWKKITKYAIETHGVRLTSHYLRKRFHSIAQKTPMPVNDWDFLMGDKMEVGHGANTYTLEDYSELALEYDKFLASRLGLDVNRTDLRNDIPTPSLALILASIEKLSASVASLRDELDEIVPFKP